VFILKTPVNLSFASIVWVIYGCIVHLFNIKMVCIYHKGKGFLPSPHPSFSPLLGRVSYYNVLQNRERRGRDRPIKYKLISLQELFPGERFILFLMYLEYTV
jgi:hypothetical protein